MRTTMLRWIDVEMWENIILRSLFCALFLLCVCFLIFGIKPQQADSYHWPNVEASVQLGLDVVIIDDNTKRINDFIRIMHEHGYKLSEIKSTPNVCGESTFLFQKK